MAVVERGELPDERMVPRQRLLHGLGRLLPALGAALDIGRQKGDQAGRRGGGCWPAPQALYRRRAAGPGRPAAPSNQASSKSASGRGASWLTSCQSASASACSLPSGKRALRQKDRDQPLEAVLAWVGRAGLPVLDAAPVYVRLRRQLGLRSA